MRLKRQGLENILKAKIKAKINEALFLYNRMFRSLTIRFYPILSKYIYNLNSTPHVKLPILYSSNLQYLNFVRNAVALQDVGHQWTKEGRIRKPQLTQSRPCQGKTLGASSGSEPLRGFTLELPGQHELTSYYWTGTRAFDSPQLIFRFGFLSVPLVLLPPRYRFLLFINL